MKIILLVHIFYHKLHNVISLSSLELQIKSISNLSYLCYYNYFKSCAML